VISTTGKDRLLRCAQALYFPERSYEGMMEKARDFVAEEEIERFRAFLASDRRDFKMEDAIEALKRAKEIAGEIAEER